MLGFKGTGVAGWLTSFYGPYDPSHDLTGTGLGKTGHKLELVWYGQRADCGMNMQL